jgi:formamidopyrimidine-DNA glycosylase
LHQGDNLFLPELPEVETIVRSLVPHVTGHVIRAASFNSRLVTRGGFEETSRAVTGTRIQSMDRFAKHILLQLDHGLIHIHLGMTGQLLWNAPATPYTRAILELDNGVLSFDDIRQFGRFNFYLSTPKSVIGLGPDALSVTFDEFYTRLRGRTGLIKALLLNQQFLGGLGNIYADEVLFTSGIHPKTRVSRLSRARAVRLYESIQATLRLAIEHRGSSISDYVDASGERGGFQLLHKVYGRTGQPCIQCRTPIRRLVVAQRGTHYCPRCQRA